MSCEGGREAALWRGCMCGGRHTSTSVAGAPHEGFSPKTLRSRCSTVLPPSSSIPLPPIRMPPKAHRLRPATGPCSMPSRPPSPMWSTGSARPSSRSKQSRTCRVAGRAATAPASSSRRTASRSPTATSSRGRARCALRRLTGAPSMRRCSATIPTPISPCCEPRMHARFPSRRSATRSASSAGSLWWRSATRSASSRPSRPASSRLSGGVSARRRAASSTTSSRPTPPSTRATRAGRSCRRTVR